MPRTSHFHWVSSVVGSNVYVFYLPEMFASSLLKTTFFMSDIQFRSSVITVIGVVI